MLQSKYYTPDFLSAVEFKRIRKKIGMTQKELAFFLHCGKATVERWERKQEGVAGPVAILMHLLDEHPEILDSYLLPEKKYPLRLLYMHGQKLCTLIDVDDINQQVRIKNYTENLMFRAFGGEESPSYARYQEFLESRCFPRSRDKMKLVLKDLDLPFYDPFLIVTKTEGRMAEDDFWIKFI